MRYKGLGGRSIHVAIRNGSNKTSLKESIIDPVGVLTESSANGQGLNEKELAVFKEWKERVKSQKLKVDYP
ncbi:hypothetical protein FE782_09420 [Paenibacillus antri]|uniref:Uncharacterized protein n=1 Tax=Paenibacillus antri TaxID=2582848 RepID=A0A5R9GCL1_9BACL|nr:hypothetical protein [Paenibacillus antri]TLS52829.1 hypothetical protein FE782_09420 [Paenibacillus antri]